MYGVDRGEQLLQHSEGFSAKAHFKNWYKRGNFGLCDFGFPNSQIVWNLSCERMVQRGQELRRTLKKWEFCVVATGEMMAYAVVDPQDNDGVDNIPYCIMILRQYGHCPCLEISEKKHKKRQTSLPELCCVCS